MNAASAADLFADQGEEDLANALKTSRVEFTGTLLRDAEVRVKPVDDEGHMGPVLCLEVKVEGPCPHTVRAERPYTEQTRKAAETLASALKKGHRVTVSSPLLGMRVYLPVVEVLSPTTSEQIAS